MSEARSNNRRSFLKRTSVMLAGLGIGGDPYRNCKAFVDVVEALKKRFKTQPELWPLRYH